FPARVAIATLAIAIGLARMRRDDLEEIERAEAVCRDLVPEPVVAAGPDQPHVAPLNFVRRQAYAVVHVVEIVLRGLRKTRRLAAGALRFVGNGCRRGVDALNHE